MKIMEAIAAADQLSNNMIGEPIKRAWLSELDGRIYYEIMQPCEASGDFSGYDDTTPSDTTPDDTTPDYTTPDDTTSSDTTPPDVTPDVRTTLKDAAELIAAIRIDNFTLTQTLKVTAPTGETSTIQNGKMWYTIDDAAVYEIALTKPPT